MEDDAATAFEAITEERRTTAIRRAHAKRYDFFICHASEDKEVLVRDLAEALRTEGAEVWYDEFSMKVGDRLRRAIDRGLSTSWFGVVVLSPHFFGKNWPETELDALYSVDGGSGDRILPVWHNVSKQDVESYSPTMASIVALLTDRLTVEQIARKLMDRLSDDELHI